MHFLSTIDRTDCLDATDLYVGPWPVDAPTYHADKLCLSHGQLEDFRESVPGYHQRHVLGTIPAKESTGAMDLGTALHFAVLEPDKFLEYVVRLEVKDFRTKAAQTARDEAEAAGKLAVTTGQWDQINAMRDAIFAHSKARFALESDGPTEYAIRWRDPLTGLWVRNLIDKLVPSDGLLGPDGLVHPDILVNLKTAADRSPEGFAKAVTNLGYHRSSALYVQGAREALGYESPTELFVVVGKEPPHEVACYILDAAALELGARQNAADMLDLAQRRASGDWSSRHAGLIETVVLSPWALKAE
jgi:hypothetical protein